MRPGERVAAMLAAMDRAPASGMMPALRGLLAEQFNARDVQLLLADYRMSVLQPVDRPHTLVWVDSSPAGRTFTTQQPVVGPVADRGALVCLPVTVRGERLGVLQFRLPRVAGTDGQLRVSGVDDQPRVLGADERQELTQLATTIGYALVVADKETDTYRRVARTERLTLAAELQWQLLPGRACSAAEFSLAGQLEPAYHVGGDNFDWCCADDHLLVSVCDGNGLGTHAALLTTLAVTALRNARRAGADLADQACLADQAVYAQHSGRRFPQMLLLRFDLATGLVRAVDAGSPLLLRLRHGTVKRVELDEQLPLGMFEGTNYTEQEFRVEPGDRLIIVSDGVHAARSPRDEEFGEAKLGRAVRTTGDQAPGEAVRSLIRELVAHHEGEELRDDAVVVCLDWTGQCPTLRAT